MAVRTITPLALCKRVPVVKAWLPPLSLWIKTEPLAWAGTSELSVEAAAVTVALWVELVTVPTRPLASAVGLTIRLKLAVTGCTFGVTVMVALAELSVMVNVRIITATIEKAQAIRR